MLGFSFTWLLAESLKYLPFGPLQKKFANPPPALKYNISLHGDVKKYAEDDLLSSLNFNCDLKIVTCESR